MQSWHLTFAADGRSALYPDEALRRRAVRALVRVAGDGLLLFCIVDDHVHVVLLCRDDQVGLRSRSLLLALRPLAGAVLSPGFVRPVEGRSHLQWLVRYCVQQPSKHGLGVHPALWTGSCFLDLAGARAIDGFSPAIRQALPRLRLRTLFEHVGLPARPLEPLDDDALGTVGHRALVRAAAASLAAPPELSGNTSLVVTGRSIAVQLARHAGLNTAQIARALQVQPNAVLRLGKRPVDPRLLLAARRYLALEERVRTQPFLAAEPAAPYAADTAADTGAEAVDATTDPGDDAGSRRL